MANELTLEAALAAEHLSWDILSELARLEPFGVGNPRPKFLLPKTSIRGLRVVGNSGQHLQAQLNIGNVMIAAIGFNLSNFAKHLKIGDTVDIAAELIEDGWNGRKEVKLRVVDIKLNDTNLQTDIN